jgi:hypothetical protein
VTERREENDHIKAGGEGKEREEEEEEEEETRGRRENHESSTKTSKAQIRGEVILHHKEE